MGFWNVNGLSSTDNNNLHYLFKQSLIQNSNLDILALSETFLLGDQHLSVPDYRPIWIGHNRTEPHPQATRGSGGVGVLIHNRINKYFNCELLNAEYEGILWVKFTARCDGSTPLLLCACYLPPETSTRRRDAAEFLDTLLGQVYEYQNHGLVLNGGDFNGRCGDLSE